jgi:uncharacterized protein (TIGR02285 family)
VLWAIQPAHAADEQIFWFRRHSPPAIFLNGEEQGQGFVDKTLDFFIDRMPEFKHVRAQANIPRFMKLATQRDPVCMPGLVKSAERQLFLTYSMPIFFLNKEGIVSTDNGMQAMHASASQQNVQHTVRAVRITGRSYHPATNAIFAQLHTAGHISVLASQLDAFKMLFAGRLDLVPAYPVEWYYYQKKLQTAVNLRFQPVQNKGYTLAYFACSNGPKGQKVIQKVNDIIMAQSIQPAYVRYYLKWLPENLRPAHQLAQERFLRLFFAHGEG